MNKFLMPLSHFNRIHQITHGVRRNIANVKKDCIFFATVGSILLNKHYKIPARPVAGVFALCINDKSNVACFGEQIENQFKSNSNAFHMWIQTETHLLDFMSPIFPEVFADNSSLKVPIPRRMFQKQRTEEVSNIAELSESGDFYTLPNLDLTEHLLEYFNGQPTNGDLLQIAETWFGRRSAKQKPKIDMINDLGEVHELSLSNTLATSSW